MIKKSGSNAKNRGRSESKPKSRGRSESNRPKRTFVVSNPALPPAPPRGSSSSSRPPCTLHRLGSRQAGRRGAAWGGQPGPSIGTRTARVAAQAGSRRAGRRGAVNLARRGNIRNGTAQLQVRAARRRACTGHPHSVHPPHQLPLTGNYRPLYDSYQVT